MKKLLALLLMVVLSLTALVGCGAMGKSKNLFKDEAFAADLMQKLKDRPELKGHNLQVFQTFTMFDMEGVGSGITIDLLKPNTTDKIDRYKYSKGAWAEPQPVTITGSGKMENNLFPLDAVDFTKIPAMNKELEAKAKEIEGGKVNDVWVIGMKFGPGVIVHTSVKGSREEYTAEFDGKGKLLKYKKQ